MLMKGHKHASVVIISGILFTIIALGHLARVFLMWDVMVAATSIPQWVSIVAIVVAGAMAVWNFKEASCIRGMTSENKGSEV